MSAMFFDDFTVGDEFVTPRRTITEADVVNFAGVSGDHNSLHTDRLFGKETPFGEPVAHGLLIISVATGLVARLGIFDGTALAMMGIDDWRFLKPVLFGDTVHVKMTIAEKRATSRPDRGVLRRKFEIVNQRGELLQVGHISLMCRRRVPAAPAADNQGDQGLSTPAS